MVKVLLFIGLNLMVLGLLGLFAWLGYNFFIPTVIITLLGIFIVYKVESRKGL